MLKPKNGRKYAGEWDPSCPVPFCRRPGNARRPQKQYFGNFLREADFKAAPLRLSRNQRSRDSVPQKDRRNNPAADQNPILLPAKDSSAVIVGIAREQEIVRQ